ncbi:MAG: bestrophin family ion channel [Legionellaceae bacterium]|nr:bestrophin family ion channel [Legionellaceae bacterium]
MKNTNKFENKYEYPDFFKSAIAVNGSVTPKVLKQVLVVTLYATFISVLSLFFHWISLSVSPFEYAGFVMGLILVFRVNAGYDRWWEARKVWGSLVNNSRSLATIVAAYVDKNKPQEIKQLMNYFAAMPYLMKNNLRGDDSLDEIKHLIDDALYQTLQQVDHKPNFLSAKIAELLGVLESSGSLNKFSFLQAEKCREIVIDCQGMSERILKTPMPFVMAVKSRRFILLFLLFLPFALVDYSVYINPIVTALVSYALFSLDQIGVELQNPFSKQKLSHLPLDNICQNIENNIMEIYKYSN